MPLSIPFNRIYVLVIHEGPFVVSPTLQIETSQKAMACAAATLILLVFTGQVKMRHYVYFAFRFFFHVRGTG